MAVGRSIHPQMHGSYGQAAGAGLVGGLIGGLIIGAIENSKAGEIVEGPAVNSEVGEKIKALAADKVVMTERGHLAASNVAVAAPVTSESQVTTTQGASDAEMQASVGVATGAPVVGAPTTTLPVATIAMADSPTTSQAQGVANQLGCGAVKASGAGGYVAPCGSYAVFIDCDTGRCRPTHTVGLEEGK